MSAKNIAEKDLVIIGAGLYGIQAARTYLEIHPCRDIAIFEASSTLGGIWSCDRVYDAFWTQTPLDIAEFSDRPLGHVPPEDQYYGFFAAKHITRYLEEYVDDHVYNGFSLRSRIKFQSQVEVLEKADGSWTVAIRGDTLEYKTAHVIDASGLTSTPKVPEISGMELYNGISLHHKNFASTKLLSDSDISNVVVIGGAKSAADVAYASAKADKRVSWIIKKSGSGPGAYFNVKGVGSYRNSNESFYTRFMAFFIASIFATYPWWISWFYSTKIGRMLFTKFWNGINEGCLKSADYDRDEGKEHGFANLKPDTTVFWQNDSSSVNQREDFFDTIAREVTVYRDDIVSMNDKQEICLAGGAKLKADAIIFATGWSNPHSYLSTPRKISLGIPSEGRTSDTSELEAWGRLDEEAQKSILVQFPILAAPPVQDRNVDALEKTRSNDPYRLYNAMLPINDHSIIFLGHIMLGNHFRASEVQALWACAILDGNINLSSETNMRSSVAKTVQWCKLRYLNKGSSGNWFYYDLIPYTDMLLRELGLESHLKSGWRNLLDPAWAKDLRGLITEYKSRCADK